MFMKQLGWEKDFFKSVTNAVFISNQRTKIRWISVRRNKLFTSARYVDRTEMICFQIENKRTRTTWHSSFLLSYGMRKNKIFSFIYATTFSIKLISNRFIYSRTLLFSYPKCISVHLYIYTGKNYYRTVFFSRNKHLF